MNKILMLMIGIMMVTLVAAAPSLITSFNEKDAVFSKSIAKATDEITAENVTFMCDGKAMKVLVNEHDVRTGYDDEFKDDKMMRNVCPDGTITAVTDWNGNKLRTYGNESKKTIQSFKVAKGRSFDCRQSGNNWTGTECKTIEVDEAEEEVISIEK